MKALSSLIHYSTASVGLCRRLSVFGLCGRMSSPRQQSHVMAALSQTSLNCTRIPKWIPDKVRDALITPNNRLLAWRQPTMPDTADALPGHARNELDIPPLRLFVSVFKARLLSEAPLSVPKRSPRCKPPPPPLALCSPPSSSSPPLTRRTSSKFNNIPTIFAFLSDNLSAFNE